MKIDDFKLEHFFEKWEFTASYMLGSSDAESHTLKELLELADEESRASWESLSLRYTEVTGHPELRAAIASLYQSVEPEQVVVFAGAQEAVFAFMNVALERDDHAIVAWPGYQSLYELARSLGCQVTLVPMRHEDGWRFDLQAVEKALRPTTRVIAVNFPHNPTGAHLDSVSFQRLADLAREAGAYLFSDEVYRYSEFSEADRLPGAAQIYEHAASLGVMSKSFGMAGLRIGWVASRDGALLRRLISFKHYLTICNSAPSEALALMALRAQSAILARNRGIAAQNLQLLDRFFQTWKGVVEWVRPRAGMVAFPRLCSDVNIAQFAEDLAREESVLILPGNVFDYPGNHFRLGFGRRNMPVALERFEKFARRRSLSPIGQS